MEGLTERQQQVRKAAEKELDRLLKTFKTQAKRDVAAREFDVEAIGLSGVSLELAKISQQVSAGDQTIASAYAREMVLAVKQLESIPGLPAREFTAAAKKVVSDILTVAEADPLIDPVAKKEVKKVGGELLAYIELRGGVFNRVRSGSNSLLKRTKNGLADTLQESGGLVLGSLGKFLRRSEEKEAQQKLVAEVAVTARKGIATASEFGEADAKESSLQRLITPRDEMGKFLKRGPWFDSLRVLKDIHGELKGQRKTKSEREAKIREANERMLEASDNASPQRIPSTPAGIIPNSGMNAPNKGMSVWSSLLQGLMTGKGAGVLPMVGKALGALGSTALVVAAGFAGWKIGEMIDKWTGASNLVQKSAEYLTEKFTGKPGVKAQERMAGEDARRLQNQRSAEVQRLGGTSGTDAENIKWLQSEAAQAARAATKPQTPKTAPAVTPSATTPTVLRHENVDQYTMMNQYPKDVSPERVSSPDQMGLTDPKDLHFSSTGFTNLVNSEGLRTKAYQDTRGVWTIGVGETEWDGKPVSPTNPGREITREEAMKKMSTRVLRDFEPMVRNQLKRPVTQAQFDSLVHLAYNTPKGAKKIIKKVNDGETVTREDFLGATKIKENERGLVIRREKEFAMFTGAPEKSITPVTRPTMLASTSATRAAAPVLQKTAELASNQTSAPIIIAPQAAPTRPIVVQTNPTPIPVPIRPRNDDPRLSYAMRDNAF